MARRRGHITTKYSNARSEGYDWARQAPGRNAFGFHNVEFLGQPSPRH